MRGLGTYYLLTYLLTYLLWAYLEVRVRGGPLGEEERGVLPV